MKIALRLLALIATVVALNFSNNAQHDQHQKHHDEVNKRGDKAMGFSHTKTTHHFRLKSDGGIIEVTTNDGLESVAGIGTDVPRSDITVDNNTSPCAIVSLSFGH